MKQSKGRRSVIASVAVLAMLGVTACGGDIEPLGQGSLALEWEVSPRGCEQADVTQVLVELNNSKRYYSEIFDCTFGHAYVEDMVPGNYQLEVSGLDTTGRVTFASPSRSVTIRAEVLNRTETLRLTARPAELEVEWIFDNGRVCGANEVDRVEVAVFDEADYEMERQRFTCNDASGRLDGFAAGNYLVEASGFSGSKITHRGLVEVVLKRGDAVKLDVVLELVR
ncbi:MAG: hypothetical protein ACNA8W_00800 [Bradymonadaceae bacterium]